MQQMPPATLLKTGHFSYYTTAEIELFRRTFYNDGGILRRRSNHKKVGHVARRGGKRGNSGDGYLRFGIKGTRQSKHRVHRVLFAMQHGWCPMIVDHAWDKTLNNHPDNLRASTPSLNSARKQLKERPGFERGVSQHGKQFRFRIVDMAESPGPDGRLPRYTAVFKTLKEANAYSIQWRLNNHPPEAWPTKLVDQYAGRTLNV